MKISEMHMNDVNDLVSEFLDILSNRIEDYPEGADKEDKLFFDLQTALGEFCNYPDYKNYN